MHRLDTRDDLRINWGKAMNTIKGYRGSSSAQASAYKRQGHTDEAIFSKLINGSSPKDSKAKTDIKGPDGLRYSVKGGAKKWQISLYSRARIKDDQDFHKIPELGANLLGCLDAFPTDYATYREDKLDCLARIERHIHEHNMKKAISDIGVLESIIPGNNSYFSAKKNLKNHNEKLLDLFQYNQNLKYFLSKSIFNLKEVDRWAIKVGNEFMVFERPDVLDIFSTHFRLDLSSAGRRKADCNVDGQKVIMKHNSNVVELEVRNDSPVHFRELRFNMNRKPAIDLLMARTQKAESLYPSVFLRRPHNV